MKHYRMAAARPTAALCRSVEKKQWLLFKRVGYKTGRSSLAFSSSASLIFSRTFSSCVLKLIPPFCRISAVGEAFRGLPWGWILPVGGEIRCSLSLWTRQRTPPNGQLETFSLPFVLRCRRSLPKVFLSLFSGVVPLTHQWRLWQSIPFRRPISCWGKKEAGTQTYQNGSFSLAYRT